MQGDRPGLEQARAPATRALSLDPNSATAFRALGNLHSFSFRFGEANEAFRRAVALNPSDAGNLNNLAMFSAMTGQEAQALEVVRRYTEVSPGEASARVLEGRVLTFLRRPQEAVTALLEAIRLEPSAYDSYFRLARAQIQLGDTVGAESSLRTGERLLGGREEGGRAIVDRAYSYSRLGLRDDALRLFALFQNANSSGYEDYGQRALAYLAIGNLEQAATNLERVVAKSEAREPDAGYFATNNIRRNVLNDPVLETSPFVELRARLVIDID